MKTCEECGLPVKLCTALTMYRKAFEAYENGDVTAAHNCADDAAAAVAEYKAEQGPPIRSLRLGDEERLILSGRFT